MSSNARPAMHVILMTRRGEQGGLCTAYQIAYRTSHVEKTGRTPAKTWVLVVLECRCSAMEIVDVVFKYV